jgi:phage tail-like protein
MSDDSSRYLGFLPAIYAAPTPDGQPSFIAGYLQIAEALLDRRDATADEVQAGMAQVLDVLSSLLDPRLSFLFPGSQTVLPPLLVTNQDGSPNAPATDANLRSLNDYVGAVPLSDTTPNASTPWQAPVEEWLGGLLRWTSGWLAFQGDPAWNVDQQRAALVGLMPLYRARGTRAGIEGMVRLFFPSADIRITDLAAATPLVLGQSSRLGDAYASGDGVLDGRRPYSFSVEIVVNTASHGAPDVVALQRSVAALIDAEKPLQTRYVAHVGTTFTIGKYSTIGRDTRLPRSEPAP